MGEARKKVLFLCTGNSCRSQMAEGWARELKADTIEVYSAGVEVHGLNPKATIVMAESGVDISDQVSKDVSELPKIGFDVVVTLCDNARERCPVYPAGVKMLHHPFVDPAEFDTDDAGEENVLRMFREVRDQIREFVEGMPGNLL